MPQNPLDHSVLFNEFMRENPFWFAVAESMDSVLNPTITGPLEELATIRSADSSPYFSYLNARMLGFNISSLAFQDSEYPILIRTLGKFWQTRGASYAFINYISYIKNIELVPTPLWASSLDMPINELTSDYGTELWNGGQWFPTSYYDIFYSLVDFPDLDENLVRNFISQLSPMHLVLRDLVGLEVTTAQLYFTAIPLDRQYYTAVANIPGS